MHTEKLLTVVLNIGLSSTVLNTGPFEPCMADETIELQYIESSDVPTRRRRSAKVRPSFKERYCSNTPRGSNRGQILLTRCLNVLQHVRPSSAVRLLQC